MAAKSTKSTAKSGTAKAKPALKRSKASAADDKHTKVGEKTTDNAPLANGETQGISVSGLPQFYKSVAPLNASVHGETKLRPASDVKFAQSANSIILSATELPFAAKFYPVVFGESSNGEISAFAVTGHTNGNNLFVSDDGKWRENCYIPAYVRRYPFILIEDKHKGSLTLAIDSESDMVDVKEGKPLYEEGKPSEVAQNALKFCLSYHQELLRSKELFKQIADSGILEPRSADVQLPDQSRRKITGFQIVDEQKLRALDDETFLALRKSGALNLIYCQLWSMKAWDELLK